MNTTVNNYLESVAKALNLPTEEKQDIIEEIRNHIYEALNKGESLDNVINKLGKPQKLAASCSTSYKLQNNEFKFSDILGSIAFYSSVAFSGMFAVTILPVLAVSLFLIAVFLIVICITNLTGFTNIPFNVGPFLLVTGVPQMVMGTLISGLLMMGARASWVGLKKYLKNVSDSYHKRRMP